MTADWDPLGVPVEGPTCGCWDCRVQFAEGQIEDEANRFFFIMSRMVVCETCGNKRCPHATNHQNKCTGSNAFGQKGSRYGGIDAKDIKPKPIGVRN